MGSSGLFVYSSVVSLLLGSADVMGNYCWDDAEGAPQGENFLKQGPKQSLLVHFEQIVKCGGGHWISVFCIEV